MDAQELQRLKYLAQAATPGPWERDTVRSEGEYGSDDDGGYGYDSYSVTDNEGRCIMDCLNNDDGTVQVGNDGHAWDEVAKHNAAFVAAANPAAVLELIVLAERAVSPAESVQSLWPLIDAYADAREEYQRSTARHLAKQQRENMEDARSALSHAISAQYLQHSGRKGDYPEPLENFQEGQWWVQKLDEMAKDATDLDVKRAVAVVHHMLHSASNAHAEGRRSAMKELAKEKERADRAEQELMHVRFERDAAREAMNALAVRQAPDLSKLQRYDLWDAMTYKEDGLPEITNGDYVKFADVQALLAQPLQQEGGEETEYCYYCSEGYRHSCPKHTQPSDNLQQASTAQAEPAKMECPTCGVDRFKAPCPNMADECPMIADAHLLNPAKQAASATDAMQSKLPPMYGDEPKENWLVPDLAPAQATPKPEDVAEVIMFLSANGLLAWRGTGDDEDDAWSEVEERRFTVSEVIKATNALASRKAAQATPEGAELPPLPGNMDTVERIQLSSIDSSEFAELMGAYASAPTLDTAWAVLQYADKRMHAIMARRFALAATTAAAEPVDVDWIAAQITQCHGYSVSDDVTKSYRAAKIIADRYRAAPSQQVDTGGLPG